MGRFFSFIVSFASLESSITTSSTLGDFEGVEVDIEGIKYADDCVRIYIDGGIDVIDNADDYGCYSGMDEIEKPCERGTARG